MNSRGSMVFRVELSNRAQADIAAIYDWLVSQRAGDAGQRWFVAFRHAVTSLSTLPTRARYLLRARTRRLKSGSSCTVESRTSTESCSAFRMMLSRYFTSATVAGGHSEGREQSVNNLLTNTGQQQASIGG